MTRMLISATAGIAAVLSAPALGQYNSPSPPKQQTIPAPTGETSSSGNVTVSKDAMKALTELQTAVNANDTASIAAKLAAAQAVVKTPAERYVVAQLQLKAANASKDPAAIGAAIEAMIASGGADAALAVPLHLNLGKIQLNAKQYDAAASSFDHVLAQDANNTDALVLLAETRNSQGRVADAVGMITRAIKVRTAAGQKADETWYKRAVALAYNAKQPNAVELSRQWVTAFPTTTNWRDALRIYRSTVQLDDAATLDALRLARATGALDGEGEYRTYARTAVAASSPVEAKAAIDEAAAAGKLDLANSGFAEVMTALKGVRGADAASLAAASKDVLAAPTGRAAMRVGDGFYGLGDYTKAAELYRAALTKSGVDTNQVNLRIGMALARGGDKAGATAALGAVTGPLAELAKFWLLYVNRAA